MGEGLFFHPELMDWDALVERWGGGVLSWLLRCACVRFLLRRSYFLSSSFLFLFVFLLLSSCCSLALSLFFYFLFLQYSYVIVSDLFPFHCVSFSLLFGPCLSFSSSHSIPSLLWFHLFSFISLSFPFCISPSFHQFPLACPPGRVSARTPSPPRCPAGSPSQAERRRAGGRRVRPRRGIGVREIGSENAAAVVGPGCRDAIGTALLGGFVFSGFLFFWRVLFWRVLFSEVSFF